MKELDENQLRENKDRFISLLKEIKREGANIEGLINKLDNMGFFEAPASTVYHCSIKGGLCLHSLNVYDNLLKLAEDKSSGIVDPDRFYIKNSCVEKESIIIVALLHDIVKSSMYEQYFKNEKKYSPAGSKRDEGGNYDWVATKSYKVKEAKDRFLFSTHGHNSEYMINSFIPLKIEESIAVIHHMGYAEELELKDLSAIYDRYPLALLLYTADLISTFVDESI